MLNRLALAGLLFVTAGNPAPRQGGAGLKSGPQPGALLGSSFHPFNLSGEHKGNYHCLVCEYGLKPVALVFAREQADAKDPALEDLLKKLDARVAGDKDGLFKSFVVFLSPDARSSATEEKVTDPEKLVEEAVARDALHARLKGVADALKNVVVSCYPEAGPPGYDLSPDAGVTVILYLKHQVAASYAFPKGKLTEAGVAEVMKGVDGLLGKIRKEGAPAPRKKEGGRAAAASAALRLQDRLHLPLLQLPLGVFAQVRQRHGVADVVLPQDLVQLLAVRDLLAVNRHEDVAPAHLAELVAARRA
jgi:hypothetical protein